MRDDLRLLARHPVLGDETGQMAADPAPPDIVPRRDRQKCARIVVEAGEIGEARSFRDLIETAPHPGRTVMEPPGRSDHQAFPISGHFGQHLAPEKLGVRGNKRALECLVQTRLLLGCWKIGVEGGRHAVVGGGRAELAEIGAAVALRGVHAVPASDVLARDLAKPDQVVEKAACVRIGHAIGPIGRAHLAGPAVGGQLLMMRQRIKRVFGAGTSSLFLRILFPLLRPGMLAALLLVLVRAVAMFELTFLVASPTTQTPVVSLSYAVFASGVRAAQSIDAMAIVYMITTLFWLVSALQFVNPTQIVTRAKPQSAH